MSAAVAVPLALGAAASFAVSNVTQMDAVRRRESPGGSGEAVQLDLLLRLVTDKLWVAGLVTSLLGFAFEAVALYQAPVVVVQPLIVAELPFALPIAALVAGRRLGPREWWGILLVSAGLAVLVGVIRPTDAPIVASAGVWAALFASISVFLVALVWAGHLMSGVARTTALAAAAGASFGLLSVITKAVTHDFATKGVAALATWQPWALAGVGLVGMTIAQNSYRAGPLAVSLPLLDVGEPVVGSLIAVFAFDEHLGHLSALTSAALVVAAIAVVAGVATLDRSPLVQSAHGTDGGTGSVNDQTKPATR